MICPSTLRGRYAEVLTAGGQAKEPMRTWGSRYARLVLERCENNKRHACDALGISYHTLQGYLRFRPERAFFPGEERGLTAGSP